jgi:hypothetical protein
MFSKSDTVKTAQTSVKQSETKKQPITVKSTQQPNQNSPHDEFIEAGEYKEPTPIFLSQKIGDFYLKTKGSSFEQTLEFEVTKETLTES